MAGNLQTSSGINPRHAQLKRLKFVFDLLGELFNLSHITELSVEVSSVFCCCRPEISQSCRVVEDLPARVLDPLGHVTLRSRRLLGRLLHGRQRRCD